MTQAILVIGCAARDHRGLDAFISELAMKSALPIVVVAHGQGGNASLSSALLGCSGLPVVEVQDKAPIVPGTIYVAPFDYHVLVESGTIALSTEAPVHGARPAIDPLFESAADSYGESAIAVLVTDEDANNEHADGVRGLARIRECGGVGLVQTAGAPLMHVLGGVA